MKRIILLLISMGVILCGCNKFDLKNETNNFIKKIDKLSSYYLKGTMEIINEEDTYFYDLEVSNKKDNYNVTLINQLNNHKQIIIKNEEGVYVVTPSLNKSFKFQSEWPANSSQAYILESLVTDIKNDKNIKYEETEDYYIVSVLANYPNNPDMKTEKIYFDKDMNLKLVAIYDSNDNKKIEVVFTKLDYKASIKDEAFKLDTFIDEECCETETTTSKLIDNVIYPLYIPEETYLKNKEVVSSDPVERIILTFAGLKNFILVEEVTKPADEFEVIPVYGEPLLLGETYGIVNANSLSWTKNNVDYYISSNDLTTAEMILIASSLNNNNSLSVGK